MKPTDAFQRELEDSPPSTTLARGLGWFSIALGAAELAVPRLLARGIGIEPDAGTTLVTRLMGARKVASGLAVLLQPRRAWPLWSRVAGDVLDLAVLGLAATRRTSGIRLAGAIAGVGAVTALDVLASVKAQRDRIQASRPVMSSVTIRRPVRAVYDAFRDFGRLPELMDYLEEVRVLDRKRSHWVAKPLGHGKTVEWDAEITEDVPGEVIAWRSVEGSMVKTRGRVTFVRAPGGDATEVRIEMELAIGGFGPSTRLAKFFSKPQIKGDLRRFKQVLETGEVLLSDATVTRKPHPAQPSEPEVIATNPHATRREVRP